MVILKLWHNDIGILVAVQGLLLLCLHGCSTTSWGPFCGVLMRAIFLGLYPQIPKVRKIRAQQLQKSPKGPWLYVLLGGPGIGVRDFRKLLFREYGTKACSFENERPLKQWPDSVLSGAQ